MKVEELTLGNIVQFKGKQIVVDYISKDLEGDGIDQINEFNAENVTGINLTGEWLTKAGFQKDQDDFHYVLNILSPSTPKPTPVKYTMVGTSEFGFSLFVEQAKLTEDLQIVLFDVLVTSHISTVHQFQNLIYILTGEELSFKQ